MMSEKYQITNEEVIPGPLPDWLSRHLSLQSRDLTSISQGGPPKILIIYPTEEARKETILQLSDKDLVIDRNLHHTIKSLEFTLIEDFRLPRILQLNGGWNTILNSECTLSSERLEFPVLNPIASIPWNRNKTKSLSKLYTVLSKEDRLSSWNSYGISTFTKIIDRLESNLNSIHPANVSSKITNELKSSEEPPFSLRDIDGIIMLNHSPIISNSRCKMLKEISRHKPIHQLTYPGNFRLGYHGVLLIDQFPITDQKKLPSWIPVHKPKNNLDANLYSSSIKIKKTNHDNDIFQNTLSQVLDFQSSNPKSSFLIIDPKLEDNRTNWSRNLKQLGIQFRTNNTSVKHHPVGFWLSFIANYCHGNNAFSLETLKLLALQKTISLLDSKVITHPTESEIIPTPSIEILTQLARNDHLLGGPGSLLRWLETLSRAPVNPKNQLEKESTQWWLLCLAKINQILLSEEDRKLLENEKYWKGCTTEQTLPSPRSILNGDDWMDYILSQINTEYDLSKLEDSKILEIEVIQSIKKEHKKLRLIQKKLGHSIPVKGLKWVEEFSELIRDINLPNYKTPYNDNLRILTPEDALGCNSDFVIISNTSSDSWNLTIPKIALLGEEKRHQLGIMRPDSLIRDARHNLFHIFNCARKGTVILDSRDSDSIPLAHPIQEYINKLKLEYVNSENYSEVKTFSLPREKRKNDGISLSEGKKPSEIPLNPLSITIPLDRPLQYDIQNRFKDGLNKPSGSFAFDTRNGLSEKPQQNIDLWSPSKLTEWIICPRRGWLSSTLNANEEEKQKEDLDPRTHGNLLHKIHHKLLFRVLGLKEGAEKSISDLEKSNFPLNIPSSNIDSKKLFQIALEELDSLAPWLERLDAVSINRLRRLTGLKKNEWSEWLSNPYPIAPSGRIGRIIEAEKNLTSTIPIAIEWNIHKNNKYKIKLDLTEDLFEEKSNLTPIMIAGMIDRVDLVPFDDGEIIDTEGSNTIAPIEIANSHWKPRRKIIIRELKTSEKIPIDRHKQGLFEEIQLATYSRMWELTHPGDLVIGAGISVIGHNTEHFVEISSEFLSEAQQHSVGKTTNLLKSKLDFRKWLANSLSLILQASANSVEGKVHPTPSEEACRFCRVSSICPVSIKGDKS